MRDRLLALIAGLLFPLAFAPYDLWPLLFVSIGAGYWCQQRAGSAREALLRGWLYGLGMFAFGISWVHVSMHDYGFMPLWMAIPFTGIFAAFLALFYGLTFYASWRLGRSALAFAGSWLLLDWVRGVFLTGFPWLYHGYAHSHTWLAGWAPVGGVWLLGVLSVFMACRLSEWRLARKPLQLLGAALLFGVIWGGGLLLSYIDWTQPTGKRLSVNLVQANIAQSNKWDPAYITRTLELYRDLTYAQPPTDLVVWPETAVPILQSQGQYFVDGIAANLAQEGRTLITGIPVDTQDADGLRIYNGIMVGGSEPRSQYLKQKLVPFGEYVPLEGLLRGLIDFFDLPMSSFSRGPADQPPLQAAGYALAPLICYEAVYPDFAARLAAQSELLITISNDSWFGSSIGPLQHLQMAQMRAIEAQRWMIRATNNGVTALIDPRGSIRQRIPQFQQEVLIGEVQPMTGLTPYLRWRSWPLIALALLILVPCVLRRRQHAR